MIRPLRLHSALALLTTALLLAGLIGCTPKRVVGPLQDSPEAAWQIFRQNYCVPVKKPGLLVKSSLYYTRMKPNKRTNRTLVSMWGDFNGPMRLDISASMGKLLAHIREDKDGLLVFYPSEKTAYAHANPVLGATRLGMPFPFSLNQLARVTVGDFSGLTPAKYLTAELEGENYIYTVHGAPASVITLDRTGRPIIIEGKTAASYESARMWRLDMDKYEDNGASPLPRMLTLSMDNGEKGVLRIKSRELKMHAWPAKATGLTLPDDVTYRRLDNHAAPAVKKNIPVVYEDKK